jgi:hypothetical protein
MPTEVILIGFFNAVRPAKLDHTAGESPDGVIAKKPQ